MRFFPWSSFSPLELSPALWLSDTGSDAGVWPDLSGNGRNATQAVGAGQPLIVTGALNGRQVRRFDGVNDYLAFDRADLSAFSLFVVNKRAVGGGTYQTVFQFLQSSTTRTSAELGINNDANYGPIIIGSNGNGTAYGKGGDLAAGSNRIISAQWAGGATNGASNYAMWTNGTSVTLANSNSVGAANGSSSLVGAVWANGNRVSFFNGDIAEIVLFPTALSTANRQRVERYLGTKYGITVA